MTSQRASGILLHPTSLPGPFGSGDCGAEARRFVDWLQSAGQGYWQVLPLGEIGPGNSPYMSSSAFAGNILLIDLEELVELGWLMPEELTPDPEFRTDRVDYGRVKPFRINCLRRAAQRFLASSGKLRESYEAFCRDEAEWLDDYALFMGIARREHDREWHHWPKELVHREPEALAGVAQECAEEIAFHKFCQWNFARQWLELKRYAHAHNVRIIGDVPIFVAGQSADVWAHQELFQLDADGNPTVVAGVPPDYFSETGQLWGNPLYRWEAHEQSGYNWWLARMRHALKFADLIRIDHFRGFAAYWEIQSGAPNAIGGKWVSAPGESLLKALESTFPHLPVIAEDLGLITPDVIELRDRFGLPGMRILQFAFGEGENHPFLPHNYTANTVAYTGTHDNDTTQGWWQTLPGWQKDFAQQYLHSDGQAIHWDMMRALSASVADTVIFPMQDVLGLGSEHRMNYPGQPEGNWEWRFSWEMMRAQDTQILAGLSAEYGRLPVSL